MVLLLVLAGVFCSCTFRHDVHEARHTVAEADSLRAEGVAYEDSAAIAQAAGTLFRVRALFPTDYAHANYYYGRVLRNRGDHPAAMQAFLRTIHSRTQDHAIKARTYANVANMCRLAAEHELAYQIYENSAQEFIEAQDTTLYYYALNNMAIALAELKLKNEALTIVNKIAYECLDTNVLTKIWETRAIAYIYLEQYDSVIYCVRQLKIRGNQETTGTLLLARAFSSLEEKDSAVYYAQQVAECTNSLFDLNNAFYILANDDERKSKEDILHVAADRSDVQKILEVRQGQLSQATQLLEQDLTRKPDLKWLLAVVITLAIIGTTLSMYIKRRRRQHRLYSQRVAKAQEKHRNLAEQNIQLEQALTQHQKKALTEIEVFCATIQNRSDLNEKLCWKDFDRMCSIANQRMFGLVDKLNTILVLNEKEMRLCVLIVIGNFSNDEMADLICYAPHSLRSIKSKIAGVLGISGKNMHTYLLKLAIGG